MPTIYSVSDPDYFDAITPPALRYTSIATREVMPGWDLGTILMGDDFDDPATPAASMLKISPGGVLPRHAHDCFRVEVVVQGSIDVGDGRILGPGDISVSRPGEFYGPHVAGPDGCLSVEIFSAARGLSPMHEDGPEADEAAAAVTARVNAIIDREKSAMAKSAAPRE